MQRLVERIIDRRPRQFISMAIRFEAVDGIPPSRSSTLLDVQTALEAAGIEFIGSHTDRPVHLAPFGSLAECFRYCRRRGRSRARLGRHLQNDHARTWRHAILELSPLIDQALHRRKIKPAIGAYGQISRRLSVVCCCEVAISRTATRSSEVRPRPRPSLFLEMRMTAAI